MTSITGWVLGGMMTLTMQQSMALSINEIRNDQSGEDGDEYFELTGAPDQSLQGLSYLVIGDGSGGSGVVEALVDLDGERLDADGFLVVTESGFALAVSDRVTDLNFENSDNVTHLLVKDFTGSEGDDLDLNDDGVLDMTPWSEIIDAVALIETSDTGDQVYASTHVGPDSSFVPGHVFRRSDGDGAWTVGAFDTDGGDDTPVAANDSISPPPPQSEWVPNYDIQGAGHITPYQDLLVKTRGIVTAVESHGFYVQDAAGDADPSTSDAVFVFTGAVPEVAVGDFVEVEAIVDEFIPGVAASGNLSVTELNSPDVKRIDSGRTLPAAVVIGANGVLPPDRNVDDDGLTVYQPSSDAIDFYEALEAMRVTVDNARAVAPINRFGEIFVVAGQGAGASGLNSRGGITLQSDDYNPERIQVQIDDDFLPDFAEPVGTGDRLGDVSGVMAYSFGNFELKATETLDMDIAEPDRESTRLVAEPGQLTLASYNVLNLDPNDLDGSDDLAAGQFERLALDIVRALRSPDIVTLQEIQDNSGSLDDGVTDASSTYRSLIDAISAAGGPRYRFADIAPQDNHDGGQPGGNIRVDFFLQSAARATARRFPDALAGRGFYRFTQTAGG